MYELDKVDREVLRYLDKDGRASFRKVAKKLGVATTTVISKYQKMKKNGIIKSATLAVDSEKLGYALTALIEINVSKGKLVEVEKKIAEKPNVYAVYDITGETDTIVIARFKTRQELNAFVKSLLVMEYVERTNTHLILNIVKEDFGAEI